MAISLGRRMQEPLHEFSSLMASEDEEILALKMHSLQDSLPKVGCVTVSWVMDELIHTRHHCDERNCIHVHVWIGYSDSCSFKGTLFPTPSPFQISVHFSPSSTLFLFIPFPLPFHPPPSFLLLLLLTPPSPLPPPPLLLLLPPSPSSSSSLLLSPPPHSSLLSSPSLLLSRCLPLLVYLIGPTKAVSGDRAGKPCE